MAVLDVTFARRIALLGFLLCETIFMPRPPQMRFFHVSLRGDTDGDITARVINSVTGAYIAQKVQIYGYAH